MAEPNNPGPSGWGRLGASSVIAAVLTWGSLVVVGRILGADDYARFMVAWGLFFTITGLLQGMQQESMRSVASARASVSPTGAKPSRVAVLVGVALALFIGLSGALVGEDVVGAAWPGVTAAMAVAAVVYSQANAWNGALAGNRAWRTYGWAVLLEASLRSAAVILAVVATRNLAWWSTALLAGGLAWAFLLGSATMRSAVRAHGDVNVGPMLAASSLTIAAAGCSSLLVAGFPVLLEVTSSAPLGAEGGTFLAALVLARAPMVLLIGLQGVVITAFVDAGGWRLSLRRTVALLGACTLGVVGVGLAGPTVVSLAFGDDFAVTGLLMAGLALATIALAMITLTGWVVLAEAHHVIFLMGWLVATVTTAVVLLSPWGLEARALAALLGGPTAGAAAHLLLVRLSPTRVRTPTPGRAANTP